MIGVRATWFCAICRAREGTYQLALGSAPVKLDPPQGWHFEDGLTVCGNHSRTVSQTVRHDARVIEFRAA
jgi:hypothetical protein